MKVFKESSKLKFLDESRMAKLLSDILTTKSGRKEEKLPQGKILRDIIWLLYRNTELIYSLGWEATTRMGSGFWSKTKTWTQKLIISKVAIVTLNTKWHIKSLNFNYIFKIYVVGIKHAVVYVAVFKRKMMFFKKYFLF